jgi:hypothetical protein
MHKNVLSPKGAAECMPRKNNATSQSLSNAQLCHPKSSHPHQLSKRRMCSRIPTSKLKLKLCHLLDSMPPQATLLCAAHCISTMSGYGV